MTFIEKKKIKAKFKYVKDFIHKSMLELQDKSQVVLAGLLASDLLAIIMLCEPGNTEFIKSVLDLATEKRMRMEKLSTQRTRSKA